MAYIEESSENDFIEHHTSVTMLLMNIIKNKVLVSIRVEHQRW